MVDEAVNQSTMRQAFDNSNKKRNYVSPQKTQQSIVAYASTAQKQTKKLNSNATPPRTAIECSYAAISGLKSPPPVQNKTLELSNNPYHSLQSEDEEDHGPIKEGLSSSDETSDSQ
jgi:hypothetical protein